MDGMGNLSTLCGGSSTLELVLTWQVGKSLWTLGFVHTQMLDVWYIYLHLHTINLGQI